jgi:hypothetical protein
MTFMQSNRAEGEAGAIGKPNLLSPYTWLTLLTPLLVLLQAILAGQGWFEDRDYFDIHEMVANIIFLVVLVQLLLTVVLKIQGPMGRTLLIMNGILLVLVIVQIALGYSYTEGETAQAGAWHIPLGMVIFGLSGAIHGMVRRLRA